jgi:hypothetical protein
VVSAEIDFIGESGSTRPSPHGAVAQQQGLLVEGQQVADQADAVAFQPRLQGLADAPDEADRPAG